MNTGLPFPFVLATGNADKAREILEIFTQVTGDMLAASAIDFAGHTCGFLVAPGEQIAGALEQLPALHEEPDIEETGATLDENAKIKADGMHTATALTSIADDTGLEVDALDGAPGAYSARYAGADATYADNVRKLVHALDGVPAAERTARFVTVAHLARPDGTTVTARGAVEGVIADAPRGGGTFGYDPVFVPREGDGRTFAEMTATEKHALSHRGRAFRALVVALGAAEPVARARGARMPLDPQVQAVLAMMPEERGLSSEMLAESRAQFGALMQIGVGAVPEHVTMREASADGVPVRIYTPGTEAGAARPLVVYIHGGGWTIGSVSDYDPLTRVLAAEVDAVVVSIDYRLAPEHPHPAAVDDCWTALQWTVAHAADLGADPERVAVAGDSAGGNLDAVLAQRAAELGAPKLALQALLYPVTDCDLDRPSYVDNAKGYFLERVSMQFFFESYCGDLAGAAVPLVSPLHAQNLTDLAARGIAPALVITAEFDPLRDEGNAYADALRSAGATVEHSEYPGMIHGFIAMPGLFEGGRRGLDQVVRALRNAFDTV